MLPYRVFKYINLLATHTTFTIRLYFVLIYRCFLTTQQLPSKLHKIILLIRIEKSLFAFQF